MFKSELKKITKDLKKITKETNFIINIRSVNGNIEIVPHSCPIKGKVIYINEVIFFPDDVREIINILSEVEKWMNTRKIT